MHIIKANDDHVPFISESLAAYYSRANQFLMYPKYKDSADLMRKHVSKRISSESEVFAYLVADENGNSLGFVNYGVNEHGIGSIYVLIAEDIYVQEALVEEVIKRLKEFGVSMVEFELFEYEEDLAKVFDRFRPEVRLINQTINI